MDRRKLIGTLVGLGGTGALVYFILRGAFAKETIPAPQPYPIPTPSPVKQCNSGDKKCVGSDLYVCQNGRWVLKEYNYVSCRNVPSPTGTVKLIANKTSIKEGDTVNFTVQNAPSKYDVEYVGTGGIVGTVPMAKRTFTITFNKSGIYKVWISYVSNNVKHNTNQITVNVSSTGRAVSPINNLPATPEGDKYLVFWQMNGRWYSSYCNILKSPPTGINLVRIAKNATMQTLPASFEIDVYVPAGYYSKTKFIAHSDQFYPHTWWISQNKIELNPKPAVVIE